MFCCLCVFCPTLRTGLVLVVGLGTLLAGLCLGGDTLAGPDGLVVLVAFTDVEAVVPDDLCAGALRGGAGM